MTHVAPERPGQSSAIVATPRSPLATGRGTRATETVLCEGEPEPPRNLEGQKDTLMLHSTTHRAPGRATMPWQLGFLGFLGFLGLLAFSMHQPVQLFWFSFFSFFVAFRALRDELKYLSLMGIAGLLYAVLGVAGVISV